MAYVKALDVSRWQGNINWPAVRAAGYEIAVVKMSGSDDGDYYDSKASQNYAGAKAAGFAVAGYHFANATDPRHEAEFFVNAMRPFEQDDVFVLDWEVRHADPVGWCATFCARVKELTGVWPLLYMNGSTFNAYPWNSNPTIANCGKWIAWYDRDPNADLPVAGTYVMHQYTSSGVVPGIAGNVDLDAWYSTTEQFRKYGYQAAQPSPAPTPTPTPTPAPQPVITTQDLSETHDIPFERLTVEDANVDKGTSQVTQQGKNGTQTIVYHITYTDGKETARTVTSNETTTAPVNEITTIGTKVPTPTPTPDPAPTPPVDPNSTDTPVPVPVVTPVAAPNWKQLVATLVAAAAAIIAALAAVLGN